MFLSCFCFSCFSWCRCWCFFFFFTICFFFRLIKGSKITRRKVERFCWLAPLLVGYGGEGLIREHAQFCNASCTSNQKWIYSEDAKIFFPLQSIFCQRFEHKFLARNFIKYLPLEEMYICQLTSYIRESSEKNRIHLIVYICCYWAWPRKNLLKPSN